MELERLARVEERLRHVEDQMDDMKSKVDEMHALLLQAKGARWAILVLAAFGGFVAGLANKLLPFIGKQ